MIEILWCHHLMKSLRQYSHKVLSVFVSMLKNDIYKFVLWLLLGLRRLNNEFCKEGV